MSFLQGRLKPIGALVGGTASAHLITSLVIPVNTRLYTPEDFTLFSVFASIVGIIAPIICLRFDAAIVMPESDEDAANVLGLSLISAVCVSFLLLLAAVTLPAAALRTINLESLSPYLWMVPVAVLVTGFYIAFQSWFVRIGRFGSIAGNRIWQSATSAGAQVGCGLAGLAPSGLLLGYLTNYAIGVFLFALRVRKLSLHALRQISWSGLRTQFAVYQRFPKYSVWEGLANGLSNSAPLLIIASMATGAEAGHLTLSLFILQAPLALLGNAIGQVYLSGAAVAHREGNLVTYTLETLITLTKSGAAPLLFVGIVAPFTFGIAFGEAWVRSGVLVAWMTPWFLLQFLASPICNALHVKGYQRAMMYFHIVGAVFRVGAVLLAGFLAKEIISEVWAVTGWFFYAAYLALILKCVGIPIFKATYLGFKQSYVGVSLATCIGLVVCWISRFFN